MEPSRPTAKLSAAGGAADTRTLSLVGAFPTSSFSFFTEELQCSATGVAAGSVTFSDADIIAIEVDRTLGNVLRF